MTVFPLLFGGCVVPERPDLLHGPYFGQDPPGMTPEIFAPGIVSTAVSEGCIVFQPDGNRALFRRFGSANLFLEGEDTGDGWKITRIAPPFERLDWRNGDFTLGPDSVSLYFTSRRPLQSGERQFGNSSIWMVEWQGSDWSTPIALPPPIRSSNSRGYPSVSMNGNIYFHGLTTNKPDMDIFRSVEVDGSFSDPEMVGGGINTEYDEYDPYVSPDESYLVFMSNGGLEDHSHSDLYISFKRPNGDWGVPINMGEPINSPANENRPFVTLDGRFFFFNSERAAAGPNLMQLQPDLRPGNGSRDIYWVDARVIEQLRPTENQGDIDAP